MIFQHTIDKVLSGEKTMTRRQQKRGERLVELPDGWAVLNRNIHVKWQVGRDYAVQSGRGRKSVARIRVLRLADEPVIGISEEDAIREGFTCRADFLQLWRDMHTNIRNAWVIEFELVKDQVMSHTGGMTA